MTPPPKPRRDASMTREVACAWIKKIHDENLFPGGRAQYALRMAIRALQREAREAKAKKKKATKRSKR